MHQVESEGHELYDEIRSNIEAKSPRLHKQVTPAGLGKLAGRPGPLSDPPPCQRDASCSLTAPTCHEHPATVSSFQCNSAC